MKSGETQGKRVEERDRSRGKSLRELRERRFHTFGGLHIVQDQCILQFPPGLYIASEVGEVGL